VTARDAAQPHPAAPDPGSAAPGPAEPGASRPLRADARRNRARILVAADTILAARGLSASTDEVARQAGVGIGTLFRHFPTKEALLEAVLHHRLRQLADQAQALAGAADPGAAFFDFFTRVVETAAAKQALADALSRAGVDVARATTDASQPLKAALGLLLARAQQAGAVRPEVRVADVLALLAGTARAVEHAGWDREAQARVLAIIFDGLRPAHHR